MKAIFKALIHSVMNHCMTKRGQITAAYLIVLFGLTLLTVAFFVPPTGVIDPSVLTAFGEILTFSGSIIGIDTHYRYKSQSGTGGGK